jgi:hypothetical protein
VTEGGGLPTPSRSAQGKPSSPSATPRRADRRSRDDQPSAKVLRCASPHIEHASATPTYTKQSLDSTTEFRERASVLG